MASNGIEEQIRQENPCCKEWKDNYSKLHGEFLKVKENRRKFRESYHEALQCAKILSGRIDKAELACSEEKARADAEKAEKDKVRITLENDGDEKVAVLEKNIFDGQTEIKRLKQLLEKEKLESASQRKAVEAEKMKYSEALKVLEEEKSKVDETKRAAAIELKKAEECRRQLESEQKNIKLEAQKYKGFEKTKAEEQRKLAGEYDKKVLQQKSYADNLSRQLTESKLKNEELNNRVQELVAFRKKQANEVRSDKSKIESIEANLVKETLKVNELNKKFEAEKRNAGKEKERADDLSRQLDENRLKIEELKRENEELATSRNLIEASGKPCNKCEDTGKMKLLKKQLKFEKERVTYAKEVTQAEKDRNNFLQQEISRIKHEFVQFSHRLGFMDKCLPWVSEGIDQVTQTRELSKIHKSKLKRKKSAVEPIQIVLQGETGLGIPSGRVMDAYKCSRKTLELTAAPLVPGSRKNITDMNSDTSCRLGSQHGGSDKKILPSSANNSSISSFSDSPVVGSREYHAFSVATTAKELAKENLKLRNCISRLSDKSNMRNNEKIVTGKEESGRGPLSAAVVGSATGEGKKRNRVVNVVESIANSFTEGKKLHVQIEGKMPHLKTMLNKQLDNPLEDPRCQIPTLVSNKSASSDGPSKKRKISHKNEGMKSKGFGDSKLVEHVNSLVSNVVGSAEAYRDGLVTTVPTTDDQGAWASFVKSIGMDVMKLLDLDNPAEEARYRMAREEPVSPTLPIIEFVSGKVNETGVSKFSTEKTFYLGSIAENDNMVPSCTFDVVDVEIAPSNQKNILSGTSHDPLHLNTGGLLDPCNDKGKERDTAIEGISLHENIPELCVVFTDTKDRESISRLYSVAKNCIAQCNLLSRSSWAVEKLLHDTAIIDLVPREKACMLFSAMLYNFTSVASRGFGKFSANTPNFCVDSFSEHMRSVISNKETMCILLKSCCLEELFILIEDFLMEARILVCKCPSSERSTDLMITISLDGVDTDLLYQKASHDQLVAGSIILASLCAAVDDIGFLCDVSYNLFRTSRIDSSLRLTILHTFADLGGQKYLKLGSYGLLMVVVRSLVTHLERMDVSASTDCRLFMNEDTQEVYPCSKWPRFPPCSKCPFSEDAVALDDLVSILLEKLQNCALAEKKKRPDITNSINSLHSLFLSCGEKSKEKSGHEGDCGFLIMNCDKSCSLGRLAMLGPQSDSISSRFLCPCLDVLSLVELVAIKMSWAWSCGKVVPQLLKMLESCELDNLAAAIFILLGQLGRIGVGSNGYSDGGVKNMRDSLAIFLQANSVEKLSFPVQIAVVTALLALLPVNFETMIEDGVKPTNIASEWTSPDAIGKWFSFLGKEQQSLASSLLQSVDVNKSRDSAGELLATKEPRRRQKMYDELSPDAKFFPALLVVREHLPSEKACLQIEFGNVARFINHSFNKSCTTSLIPRLCFLTSRDIQEDEELTFRYIKQGSTVSVTGVIQWSENVLMIVPPSEPFSTGCQWTKCILKGIWQI